MSGNRLNWSQGLLTITADTSTDDTSYAPEEVWTLPVLSTTSYLTVTLETVAQSGRQGIRVVNSDTLPGTAGTKWSLEYVGYQGAAPSPLIWVSVPLELAVLNHLITDPIASANYRFRLVANEAGKSKYFQEATITTGNDTIYIDTGNSTVILTNIADDFKITDQEKVEGRKWLAAAQARWQGAYDAAVSRGMTTEATAFRDGVWKPSYAYFAPIFYSVPGFVDYFTTGYNGTQTYDAYGSVIFGTTFATGTFTFTLAGTGTVKWDKKGYWDTYMQGLNNAAINLVSAMANKPASGTTLGLVKQGTNITIASDGTISSSGGGGSAAWGAITGTLSSQTDLNGALAGKAASSHTHLIADLPAYPTLSGLGGQPLDADLTSIAGLTGTTGNLTKTAANTWALDTTAYSTTAHTHTYSALTSIPSTFAPSAHSHLIADLPAYPTLSSLGASASGHTHAYSALTSIPSTFAPSAHSHLIADLPAYPTLSGLGGQPLDADLTAIAALAGTSGLLKKTAADTWALDTATYSTTAHNHSGTYQDAFSTNTPTGNSFIKIAPGNVISYDNNTYSMTNHNHTGTYEPKLSGSGFVKANGAVITYDATTYLSSITSGNVTTALGYTPYQEGTALDTSTITATGNVQAISFSTTPNNGGYTAISNATDYIGLTVNQTTTGKALIKFMTSSKDAQIGMADGAVYMDGYSAPTAGSLLFRGSAGTDVNAAITPEGALFTRTNLRVGGQATIQGALLFGPNIACGAVNANAGGGTIAYPFLASNGTTINYIYTGDNGLLFRNNAGSAQVASLSNTGAFTALSLAITGGASTSFLKADGTVDNNAYSTTAHTHAGYGAGTVTSVSGTGTVSGLTLTGTVTGSGSLTLGGSITGFAATSHSHLIADLPAYPTLATLGASASGHTHAYSALTSIPSTFAPSAHSHLIADLPAYPTLAGLGGLKNSGSFSTWTTDGLFGTTATPAVFSTPGQSNGILFGYGDGGSGQYVGRIGFQALYTVNQAATKASLGLEPTTGDFTIRGGASNTTHLTLAQATGNATFAGNVIATGDITTGSAFRVSNSTGGVAQGSLTYNSGTGLSMWAKTGTGQDFMIWNAAGSSGWYMPTGTSNFVSTGTIGATNFSGSHSGTSSGTNTGDQTTITGNAGTANQLMVGATATTFAWNNASDTPTYVWATNAQGSTFLAARTALTVGSAATATTFSTSRSTYKGVTDGAVAGQLMWKNYGNGHTIFDASNSTTPSETACSNTNSDVVWVSTYPTLMGWNGASTYGVRVDSARVSDSCSGNAVTATTAVACSGNAATATTATNVSNGYLSEITQLAFKGVGTNSGNYFAANHYAIGQAPGTWTHPFPDLIIGYHTGIRIGALTGYGGIRFYDNSPTTDGTAENLLFSIGNVDSDVRVTNNLHIVNGQINGSGGGLTGTAASLTAGTVSSISGHNNNVLTNGAGYITASGSCAFAGSATNASLATSAGKLTTSSWDNVNISFNTTTLNPNPAQAAIEVREYNRAGAGTGAAGEAPTIGFHWSGRTYSQIGIDGSAVFTHWNYDKTAYAPIRCSTLYATADVQSPSFSATTGFTATSNTADYIGLTVNQTTTGRALIKFLTSSKDAQIGMADGAIYMDGFSAPTAGSLIFRGSAGTNVNAAITPEGQLFTRTNLRVGGTAYVNGAVVWAPNVVVGAVSSNSGGGTIAYPFLNSNGTSINYIYTGSSGLLFRNTADTAQIASLTDAGVFTAANFSGSSSGTNTGDQTLPTWSTLSGKPTNLSSFTNDLGNYGSWITASGSCNYATSSGSCTGNAATATNANPYVNYSNDSASTYQMIWGSGNAIYGTAGIYCNPSTDIVYATDFSASSDKRLKKEITPITNALDKISKITGVNYKWNDLSTSEDKETIQAGVIAQEVLEVFPEAVNTDNEYMSVSYDKLVPLLIQGMKEQQEQIKQQQEQINSLLAFVNGGL